MGQRMVVLNSTYTGFGDNSAVLHVSQVPPNPAILAPGPALLFVVDGRERGAFRWSSSHDRLWTDWTPTDFTYWVPTTVKYLAQLLGFSCWITG